MIETNLVVHQLLPEALEWFDRKRLRKEISEILVRENMRDTEIALLHIWSSNFGEAGAATLPGA